MDEHPRKSTLENNALQHGGRGQRKSGNVRGKKIVRESGKCQEISKLVREK